MSFSSSNLRISECLLRREFGTNHRPWILILPNYHVPEIQFPFIILLLHLHLPLFISMKRYSEFRIYNLISLIRISYVFYLCVSHHPGCETRFKGEILRYLNPKLTSPNWFIDFVAMSLRRRTLLKVIVLGDSGYVQSSSRVPLLLTYVRAFVNFEFRFLNVVWFLFQGWQDVVDEPVSFWKLVVDYDIDPRFERLYAILEFTVHFS